MSTVTHSLAGYLQRFKDCWRTYLDRPGGGQFVELTVALHGFTEQCKQLKLPGLSRLTESLRHDMLALSGIAATNALRPTDISALTRRIDAILDAAAACRLPETDERRAVSDTDEALAADPAKPRSIWLVADQSHPWVEGLTEQLTFFGFGITRFNWDELLQGEASPLVILFIPQDAYGEGELDYLQNIRTLHPLSQLFCLGVPELLDPMVTILRAGADVTIPVVQETSTVLAHVLDLIESQDQEPYRVLVVEDSPTASAMIARTLSQHGIDNHAISSPENLLEEVWRYHPDLVLMDMHMPHCTGVEATRVLRQIPAYQALPVVYLSSETDMGMQVAALRLGGDQFINKPFNAVLMTTIVKTKIERYREMQRSSQHDGLTGLLNHTASKMRLAQILPATEIKQDKLCVAMIDIDRFKSINDTYGHPVGDQVIRNLAWLLKGRLRTSDIIGRYGGEEFIAVLRGVGLDDAYALLDRIRQDFANLPHTHAEGSLSASFSAGIAEFPRYASDTELIDAADNALLEAKSRGRNRIMRADEC